MAADRIEHRQQGLALMDQEALRVKQIAGGLSETDWARPSNCPPWPVKFVFSHLVRGADGFRAIVDAGMQGETTFPGAPGDAEERMRALAELRPGELINEFEASQKRLRDRLAGLSEGELERYCPHRRGLQPAWWMVDQRLSELTFHGWDLDVSLGHEREVDATVADFLLPTLMERNLRTWYRAGPGGYGHFLIQSNGSGRPGWVVSPSDGGVAIERGSEGDPVIEADAAALIRFLYGRASAADLEKSGRLTVQGMRWRVDAWHEMFPSP